MGCGGCGRRRICARRTGGQQAPRIVHARAMAVSFSTIRLRALIRLKPDNQSGNDL
jgi:hypothetical protein